MLDAPSGVAGDMLLGALLDLGLDAEWLDGLPAAVGLEGVVVRRERAKRGEIACWKVDFEIPPQPHGRHLKHIVAIVNQSAAPDAVKTRAIEVFRLLTECEAAMHGTTVERVHLHEVGAVDAILDVLGFVWGLEKLGVERLYAGPLALGDGFVESAHGRMAVPPPAVIRLVEGLTVTSGPPDSGELTTPTGAALVRVLSAGPPPQAYRPLKTGFGAGTKDFAGRANAVRITIAESVGPDDEFVDERSAVERSGAETRAATVVACDVDDATGESLAAAADELRRAGALDVTLLANTMKKGRPGVRIEAVVRDHDADAVERAMLLHTPTIGVRRWTVVRTELAREERTVTVSGQPVRVKVATLPDGARRAKAESDDIGSAARASGRSRESIAAEAAQKALE